jgi:hypothetical protein
LHKESECVRKWIGPHRPSPLLEIILMVGALISLDACTPRKVSFISLSL